MSELPSVLINDYPGYPYPVQVSRELARRGFTVIHTYTPSISTTPTGEIAPLEDDPDSLSISPVSFGRVVNKHNLIQRFFDERAYGKAVAQIVKDRRPEIVVSANCPLDANQTIQKAAVSVGARFIYWVQDLLGVAAKNVLSAAVPIVGGLIGERYRRMEVDQLRRSDSVVVLSSDFVPIIESFGVQPDRIRVIENWAPIENLPAGPRETVWATQNGYTDKFVFLYAGSLGMKHNPELIAELARAFAHDTTVRIVVLSRGNGADYLAARRAAEGLENLDVRPYEPFSKMPEVLASADVLLGILESSAGIYSVPSKVLAYLCAQRPILASIPGENLASRILTGAEAGLVAEPDDVAGFVDMARRLRDDQELRFRLGNNARAYAEETFDIRAVADRFEEVLAV